MIQQNSSVFSSVTDANVQRGFFICKRVLLQASCRQAEPNARDASSLSLINHRSSISLTLMV